MDGGIDSDMGIHINGGTVIASGNMLDRISESEQTYAVLNFGKSLGTGTYRFKNSDHAVVFEKEIENNFTSLIISSPELLEGDYTLWYNDTQLVGALSENGGMMFGGGMPPNMGEMPEGMTSPPGFNGERGEFPEGFDPEKMKPDMDGMIPPDGFNGGRMEFDRKEDSTIPLPDGTVTAPSEFEGRGPGGNFGNHMPNEDIELSEIFTIKPGANYFSFIEAAK